MRCLTPTLKLILPLVLLIACLPVRADLVPFRAEYKADYDGVPVSAKGVRELRQLDDGSWEFTSSASAFIASIRESSRFRWTDDTMEAAAYRYKRGGIGRRTDRRISFDWVTHTATAEDKRKPWQLDNLPVGTLDKLGVQMKLQQDVAALHAAGKPLDGARFSYQVADDGRLKNHVFTITGTERLDTRLGPVDTIVIKRQHSSNARQSTVWLAPGWAFMMVRFKQVEAGDKGFELVLTRASVADQPLAALAQ